MRVALLFWAGLAVIAYSQPRPAPQQRSLAVAPQSTVKFPTPWTPSAVKYRNAQELVLTNKGDAAQRGVAPLGAIAEPDFPVARVMITTETRLNPADAVKRLQDIAASRPEPARFVEIGGWPAVEIEFTEALPVRGQEDQNQGAPPRILRAIIAVAAESRVIKFEISLAPGAAPELLQQAEQIARTYNFVRKANPAALRRTLETLQQQPPRQQSPPPPAAPPLAAAIGSPTLPRAADAQAPAATGAVRVQGGVGELEIAASSDARTIVIASNNAVSFSTNLGSTFTAGATGVFGLNDPSLARGVSGNFYLGVIAFPSGTVAQQSVTGCTNAVSRSTDNGANFALRGYSARCPQSGAGLCFPDQEHIASDAVNAASGNDQVYAVWRNFTPSGAVANCGGIGSGFVTSSITCSQNSGTTFTATAAIPGAGDFPRLAVGRDGNVYVVTTSGNNVLLNRFSSCATGLAPAAGFPVTVATMSGAVACPVSGLDRCNNGNILSSPTVAPDPNNAGHVLVSFAESDGTGGERIVTAESTNFGASFPNRVTVSGGNSARRFMPWSCAARGTAYVGWYDRSASTAATNDRTEYFVGSAWGGVQNLSNNPDPQCASGWPCAPRGTQDSESCNIQPQAAGVCLNAANGGSGNRCDFSTGPCPAGETCRAGGGCPKYGDYNGIACAGNFVIAAWASATAPSGLPAAAGLNIYSTNLFSGSTGSPIWRYTGTPCSGDNCSGWQKLDWNWKTAAIAAAGSQLYQLHNDGSIWRHTGTACDHDSCPGWQRLDRNSKTIAIAAGGGDLYQLHNDGRIWRFTGTTCTGDSCPGWSQLDNNSKTTAIAANGSALFQLHNDGRIFRSTGTPCSGESCPGWSQLDNNPKTVAIAAGSGQLYQLHNDGRIFRFTGTACSGESCPGWSQLDINTATVAIAAGGGNLYQLHNNGSIWRFTGTPCSGTSCPGWQKLDQNSKTVGITASDSELYQVHNDGWIWRFTGTACSGASCPGWQRLDNNSRTRAIAAGNQLYQLHTDPLYQMHTGGRIWRFTGTDCDGDICPGWVMLDANPNTREIAAAGLQLFQRHADGKIWRHTGVPCAGPSCPGWQMLDTNPNTRTIAAGAKQLFQMHADGKIWRFTGTPCSGTACPGWQMLDTNPNTRAITAEGRQLYQLHADGKIWRHTGTPCTGASCPGWQMLDNNSTTRAIASGANALFQLHTDGSIWRYTGTPCATATSCPGWQKLDANPATTSIAAGGNQLLQLHSDGSIWRYTGTPCATATSCPGWQKLDSNAATREIKVTGDVVYQRHSTGAIWRYTGTPCATSTSCPGWRRVDANPATIAIAAGGF